ncbi:MAG: sugar phosphate isomerase/epimerase [Lachnospiraceae bacterium]
MAKIAIQIMLLKDEVAQDGAYEVFRKLKEIGVNCVEMSQIDMTTETVAEVKRACEDFDMEIAAISGKLQEGEADLSSIVSNYDKIVADAKALGTKYVRMGSLPGGYTGSAEKAIEFAKLADEYATRLEAEGIKFYFHNHHREFVKYNGEFMMHIMRDASEKLGFEIDVFWAQRGGVNPVEFIKGYAGRLDLLHIKDYKIIDKGTEVEDEAYKAKYPTAYDDVVRFAEIGEGNLPMKEIIDTAVETLGTEYVIIEQDLTYGRDKYECYKLSVDNLKKMGYGEMV